MNAQAPRETDAREILKEIVNHYCDEIEKADLMHWREAIRELRKFTMCNYSSGPDCLSLYINLPGLGDFNIMHSREVDQAAQEYIEDLVRECYLAKDFPYWIAIDWERTAKNVTDIDGYGPTLSPYDGVELSTNNYYIFRTA